MGDPLEMPNYFTLEGSEVPETIDFDRGAMLIVPLQAPDAKGKLWAIPQSRKDTESGTVVYRQPGERTLLLPWPGRWYVFNESSTAIRCIRLHLPCACVAQYFERPGSSKPSQNLVIITSASTTVFSADPTDAARVIKNPATTMGSGSGIVHISIDGTAATTSDYPLAPGESVTLAGKTMVDGKISAIAATGASGVALVALGFK